MRRVLRIVQDQRDKRYNLLRGYFHGADDDTVNELEQERLSTLTLPHGAPPVGKPVPDFALKALGVRLVSLRRSSGKPAATGPGTLLEAGDTLVLSGLPENLALAEQQLLKG
jgi:CPA2 family monovalent cation:H+ antiporter-2